MGHFLDQIVTIFLSLIIQAITFAPMVTVLAEPHDTQVQQFSDAEQAPPPNSQKKSDETSSIRKKSSWQNLRTFIQKRHLENSTIATLKSECFRRNNLCSPKIYKPMTISNARIIPLLC
jgi:hypothetical protein